MRNRGTWLRCAIAAGLVLLAGFSASIPAASAAPAHAGQIRLAGGGAKWKLLVPLRLPLLASGQRVNGKIELDLPNGRWSRSWEFVAHAGQLRSADRRNRFSFVRGVRIRSGLARSILRRPKAARLTLSVAYRLPRARQADASASGFGVTQVGLTRAAAGQCETLPRFELRPTGAGTRRIALPTCGRKLNWRVSDGPDKGEVDSKGAKLLYRPDGRAGADEVAIDGYFKGRQVASQRIQLRLIDVPASSISVAALGDSVTAGFGYFGATGKQMGITQLDDCRPGATVFNDACSSNSYNRNSSVGSKPDYLPDYGLSRNISWAAQWANEYGITNYRNYAVTGSAPTDWLPGGQFNSTLNKIEQQNPDYILLTMGANPLLSDVLFGIDNMGCALESDLFGDFRQCVLDAFEAVDLDDKLNQLYSSLVTNTTSRIVAMQYHLSIPASALAYSAVQIEEMGDLLNEVIADEAATVSDDRITVITPPRFDVGIDMRPLYPADYSCSFLGYGVDGPSVQATVSQDELELDHPLSFCSGPAVGPPWVISGDTGIHPSAAGYSQMASQIPAPAS